MNPVENSADSSESKKSITQEAVEVIGDKFDQVRQALSSAIDFGTNNNNAKGNGTPDSPIMNMIKNGGKEIGKEVGNLILNCDNLYKSALDSQVPGAKIGFSNANKVLESDKNGNPTKVDGGAIQYGIKYDSSNRVTELNSKWETSEGKEEHGWKTNVEYNDKDRTQTITQADLNGENSTVVKNHFDAQGKLTKEEYTNYGEKTTSHFDDLGRVHSQEIIGASINVQNKAIYEGGAIKASSSISRDEHGKIFSEQTVNYADKKITSAITKSFDENGKLTKSVEADFTNRSKPLLKQTVYGKDGEISGINEIKMDRPYLISELTQKDANGDLINTIKPEWKMNRSMGIVKSLEVKDAEGNIKTITGRSQGADADLFRNAAKKITNESRAIIKNHLDKDSPGKYILELGVGA